MGRRCAVTIQASQVEDLSTDNTKFPILLDESNTPFSDMETYAKVGLADLRAYTNNDDTGRLPVEVVSYDTTANTCEIWVSGVSISAVSNTTFYLRYGESSWTLPADNAEFGRDHVWGGYAGGHDEYIGVWHVGESSGSASDSTGNGESGTFSGDLPDSQDAKIGKGQHLDGTGDYIDVTGITQGDIREKDLTFSAWVNVESNSDEHAVFATSSTISNSMVMRLETDGSLTFWSVSFSNKKRTAGSIIALDTDYHVVFGYDHHATTGDGDFYVDGAIKANTQEDDNLAEIADTTDNLQLGCRNSATWDVYNGVLTEVRLQNVRRTANWIETEYNNQNSPGTFIVEGTPENVGDGIAKITGVLKANITKITGVLKANISKIASIDF